VTARLLHGLVAVLAWAGIAIDVVWLPFVEPEVPASLAYRYVEMFSFFTILSTLLVAMISTLLAIDPHRDGRLFRVLRLDALVCIVITGVVYHLLLAATHEVSGPYVVSNLLEHTLVPVATVVVWLLVGPRPRADARTVGLSVVLPLVWVAWTFTRGAVVGWYPYPFLDRDALGLTTALVNTGGVAVTFLVLATLAAGVERLLPAAPRPAGAVTDATGDAPTSETVDAPAPH
jgi:hypothetical protein